MRLLACACAVHSVALARHLLWTKGDPASWPNSKVIYVRVQHTYSFSDYPKDPTAISCDLCRVHAAQAGQ